MSRCFCGRETKLDEVSRPRTHVYSDQDSGEPFMYLLFAECGCGTTRTFALWQNEECAAEEFAHAEHEQQGAERYASDEAPLDRATYRPFFSLTHELAERGL